MENKRKSFFNELGFKPTIEKLVDLTAKLYLEDDNPWVVGYSGGKDSSACLQLMWRVLEKIKSENRAINLQQNIKFLDLLDHHQTTYL